MSCAFNSDGDVTKVYGTSFGAIRNGVLRVKDTITTLTKLTLNGVSYDFQKQAKEGLVVCGYKYENVTFFLPVDSTRQRMISSLPEDYTINDYFNFLATSDYADVKAWDNFIIALMAVIKSYSSFINPSALSYTLSSIVDNSIVLNGVADFSNVNSSKEFFNAIYISLPNNENPLSSWIEEDGVVSMNFTGSGMSTNFYVGRK